MSDSSLLASRERARMEARKAIYGNVERTPADWTLRECFEAMRKEKAKTVKERKGKQDVEVIEDGADGPMFHEGGND